MVGISTTNQHRETASLAAFVSLGLLRKTMRKLIMGFEDMRKAYEADSYDHLKIAEQDLPLLKQKDSSRFERCFSIIKKFDISSITIRSDDYPPLLKEISMAPLWLFCRGDKKILSSQRLIAVVGSRNATEYGKQAIHELIPPLIEKGAVIVSGLAYGIDSLAHQKTLDCGGKCVAVFGTGVDRIYPAYHRDLAKQILEKGGALISEYALETGPIGYNFPERNRIISGLSKAVLVIEAREKSGSLITAQWAADQNRDVYTIPGSIFSENQKGTNALISEGAHPVFNGEDLLMKLGFLEESSVQSQQELQFSTPEEEMIYKSLQSPRSLDDLAEEHNLPPSILSQTISRLELKGMIRNFGGAVYRKVVCQ